MKNETVTTKLDSIQKGVKFLTDTTGVIYGADEVTNYIKSVPMNKRLFMGKSDLKGCDYLQFTLLTNDIVMFFNN